MPLTRRKVGQGKRGAGRGKPANNAATENADESSKEDGNVVIELELSNQPETEESDNAGLEQKDEEVEGDFEETEELEEDNTGKENDEKQDEEIEETEGLEAADIGGESNADEGNTENMEEGDDDNKETEDTVTVKIEKQVVIPEAEKMDKDVKQERLSLAVVLDPALDSSEIVEESKVKEEIDTTTGEEEHVDETTEPRPEEEAVSDANIGNQDKDGISTEPIPVETSEDTSAEKDNGNSVLESTPAESEQFEDDTSEQDKANKSTDSQPVVDGATEKEKEKEVNAKPVEKAPQKVEPFISPPFPASLAKLSKLTVTIGPIQQSDLLSKDLHEILKMICDFEIKFEGKIKTGSRTITEKVGFVRTQFKIETPSYLVKMATLLGNLNIGGKDMSVKFPEIFNSAVKDCREYLKTNKDAIIQSKKAKSKQAMDIKKRTIVVKNIPENTTEDTMKALFPECLTVDFREEEDTKTGKKIGCAKLLFETEKACIDCFDNNKDVEIGDSRVEIKRLYIDMRRPTKFGRGRGFGGRGQSFGGGFVRGNMRGSFPRGGISKGGNIRGGGMSRGGNMSRGSQPIIKAAARQVVRKPGPNTKPVQGQFDSADGKNEASRGKEKLSSPKVGGNVGGQNKRSSSNDSNQSARRRTESGGPDKSPSFNRRGNDRRRSGGSDMGPPKSKQRNTGNRGNRGGQFQMPNRSPQRPQNRSGNRGMNVGGQNQRGRNVNQLSPTGLQGGNMMRQGQFSQGQSSRNTGGNSDEDPMAMMMYLKNTIAKMEEKISQRTSGGRGDGYGGESSGGGGGYNDFSMGGNRKRRGGIMDSNRNTKQQRFQDRNKADNFSNRNQSSGFQAMQQNYGGNSSSGYGGNTSSGYGANTSSGYGANTSASYGGNSSAGYGTTSSAGYGTTSNASYGTTSNTGYGGNSSASYGGNYSGSSGYQDNFSGNSSFQGTMGGNNTNFGSNTSNVDYDRNRFSGNQGNKNTTGRYGGGMW